MPGPAAGCGDHPACAVNFIVNGDDRRVPAAQLGEEITGDLQLPVGFRACIVADRQDEVGVRSRFEGGVESSDQLMGQPLNEADGVDQDDMLPAGQDKLPGGRVEGREELILCIDVCVGQLV